MSSSRGNSLLRIAMPVVSSVILAYYVFTLPMSFIGGGGSTEIAAQTQPAFVPTNPTNPDLQKITNPTSKGQQKITQPTNPVQVKNTGPMKSEIKIQPRNTHPTNPDTGKDGPKKLESKIQPNNTSPTNPHTGKDLPKKPESKIQPNNTSPTNPIKQESVKQVKNTQTDEDLVPILDAEPKEQDKRVNSDVLENEELGTQDDLTEEERFDFDATSVFHSYEIFKKNYEQMEKKFKVFIYPDGDPNTYYQTPRKLTGKYASEGYFFQNLRESKFVTRNPSKAHLFFIPISCHKMRGKGINYERMQGIVQEYVEGLIAKYPYWNRTLGADHFFVTCHDVGARATNNVANLVKNSIRVVCSPSYNGDFIPHKDVAMPQVLQPFALPRGGNDVKNRTILGFWAGHRNSKIRVTLAKLWEDDDILSISNNRISRAIGELVYQKQFYRSKFCICPGGSQVNSARIVDSIHYGCVPVILSDYYDLPFNDVLDWSKFAVLLRERDVLHLKSKLQTVAREKYLALHQGLLQVQDRFEWHSPPKPYDAFYMVMYELWLRHFTVQYKK